MKFTNHDEKVECRASGLFDVNILLVQSLHWVNVPGSRDRASSAAAVRGRAQAIALSRSHFFTSSDAHYIQIDIFAHPLWALKKNTQFNNIQDLKNKRSCHNPYGSFSGFDAPLYYLINNNQINNGQCVKNLGDFFSGGVCLPNVEKLENNPTGDNVNRLKKQCGSDSNPAKCLAEGRGDVAFVSSEDLPSFDFEDYELLCLNKNGGRDVLTNYNTCNIAMAPSRTWLAAKEFLSDVSIAHAPLSLAVLLDQRYDLFNMYGEFLKNNNVIFSNKATGLATTEKVDFDKFKAIHEVITNCGVA